MQRPPAVSIPGRQLTLGPRRVRRAGLIFFVLVFLPLGGNPYRCKGPKAIGSDVGSGVSAEFYGLGRKRYTSPLSGWPPSRPGGIARVADGHCASSLHASVDTTTKPSHPAAEGGLSGESTRKAHTQPRPPAKFVAEEHFLHELLTRIFTLHLRMQDLLQYQQQQSVQLRSEDSAVSLPTLHLYEKKDGSCVAAADIVAQVFILASLRARFPDDVCIAEETADLFSPLLPEGAFLRGPAASKRGPGQQLVSDVQTAVQTAAEQLFKELRLPEKLLTENGASPASINRNAFTDRGHYASAATLEASGPPVSTVLLATRGAPWHLLREVVWLLAKGSPQHLLALLREGFQEGLAPEAVERAACLRRAAAATTMEGREHLKVSSAVSDAEEPQGGWATALLLRGLQRLLCRPGAFLSEQAAIASPETGTAASVTSRAPAAGETQGPRGLRCWLIDPIDGTRAFFEEQKHHCFSTAVALLVSREQGHTAGELPKVVLASICCPSYDLWNSCRGSNMLPLCSPGTSKSPAPADKSGTPTDSAADAAPSDPESGIRTLLRGHSNAREGAIAGVGAENNEERPLLCAERLRGCVLTKAEDLPARLTVRDIRSGALLQLVQQQEEEEVQGQQQQAAPLQPVAGSTTGDWPWCINHGHRGARLPAAATGAATPEKPSQSAANASSVPFRWTVSTPNYERMHSLLQEHLSSPLGGPAPSWTVPPEEHPLEDFGSGRLYAMPYVPYSKIPPEGLATPTKGDSSSSRVPNNLSDRRLARDAPSGRASKGQQFLALRCGHIVKYLAVALGHADAFLLLPTRYQRKLPVGPAAGCLSAHTAHLVQPQARAHDSFDGLSPAHPSPQGEEATGRKDGASVACGRPLLMVWDHAAGAAIVEMLGGVVLDSAWQRVQSYCYLPPKSPSDVASRSPEASAQGWQATTAARAAGSPQSGALLTSFLRTNPLPLQETALPPVAFALRGEALVAARNPQAAARAFAALGALKNSY
ncbi:hypothetical protein cyc_07613 [Cyclospora cayetanensis]|uniref:Inositol monophosphatase domain-containing protein n=1 Tax=Cyclospora cayetanensis TaxID=88456 RepID=A0A1D3D9R7_9EIME|nr:hypothetical protein cyc_07613 [Cyclospora cayetanensis]